MLAPLESALLCESRHMVSHFILLVLILVFTSEAKTWESLNSLANEQLGVSLTT